jgi:hypothetical protein
MQNQRIKSLNKRKKGNDKVSHYWIAESLAGTALAAMSSSSLANLGSSISSSANRTALHRSLFFAGMDENMAFTGAAGSLTKSITGLERAKNSSKVRSSLTMRKCLILYIVLLKKGYKNAIIACKQFICNCYSRLNATHRQKKTWGRNIPQVGYLCRSGSLDSSDFGLFICISFAYWFRNFVSSSKTGRGIFTSTSILRLAIISLVTPIFLARAVVALHSYCTKCSRHICASVYPLSHGTTLSAITTIFNFILPFVCNCGSFLLFLNEIHKYYFKNKKLLNYTNISNWRYHYE